MKRLTSIPFHTYIIRLFSSIVKLLYVIGKRYYWPVTNIMERDQYEDGYIQLFIDKFIKINIILDKIK